MKNSLLAGVALLCLGMPMVAQADDLASTAEGTDADIVVTGQRAQQERSIDAKRAAIGVLDVAAADEIGQLPDRNVAEVIEHLPGVGVTYDQGEGRYVAIRGVPSNLNGYTLNGMEIGNPDGNTRSLPLDIVSGQLLNRIEIAKVKTADMDGQGIGGTVNLVTQTAFDFKDRFNIGINAQTGYQELNKKVPVRGDASLATRFGSDDQFGIVLGGSYSRRDFASEGFYPDDWRPVAGLARGGAPTNIKYTEYNLVRERIGATGSFDWHPSDRQTFYIRSLYSKFTEDEVRPRYRLDFATDAIVNSSAWQLNPDGLTGTVTGTAAERRTDLRLDYKAKEIFNTSIGGSTDFGALKLDYSGGYTRNKVLDNYKIWQFRCNPGVVDFDFSQPIYSATPRTECTANQMAFRQYQDYLQEGREEIWQGKIDATYGLGDRGFLKFGAKYRNSDRVLDQRNDTYAPATSAYRFSLGGNNLQGSNVIVYPDDSNTSRAFLNSPTIDPAKILAFTAANLSNTNYFKLDTATSLSNATLNDFSLTEDVASAYVMGSLKFGVVTITPGLRFEHTKLNITGYQLQGGSTVIPASRSNSYDDWLPSLIVRVEPSDHTVFRFAYSRSLGRPEYNSMSPGGTVTVDPGVGGGAPSVAVSMGNPDLKPYRADNLDATAEWYFAPGGLLSVGVFAKFIKNPIFTQSYTLFNATFNGTNYQQVSYSQPLNADEGDIIGIEAQYEQQFTFLPGLLSGFGIALNGTLTDSKLKITNGSAVRTSTFPGQSKYLYGAKLFYQKGIVQASISYHNTGYALLSAGGITTPYADQYNNDLRRLDAKASFQIVPQASIFFEAQNLTDEPTRQYQGGNKNWIIQNERYGRTFYAGISAKF